MNAGLIKRIDTLEAQHEAKHPRLSWQEINRLFDNAFSSLRAPETRVAALSELQEICPAAPGEQPTFTVAQVAGFLDIKACIHLVMERAKPDYTMRYKPQAELEAQARQIEAEVYPLSYAEMKALLDRAFTPQHGRPDAAAQARLVELYPDNGEQKIFTIGQVLALFSLEYPFFDFSVLEMLEQIRRMDEEY